MTNSRFRRSVSRRVVLRFSMMLAAAFLAALAAHVSIDIAGDYLLAHDAYDDPAHGSRWFASIAFAVCSLGALVILARAALAETRGSRGALRAALRASVPASSGTFALGVTAAALPFVAAMAWLDAAAAGLSCDDVADLFGGSIPLGSGITAVLALVVAFGAHALVALLGRKHRAIVRAVEAFACCVPRAPRGPAVIAVRAPRRTHRRVARVRGTGGNRAPPTRALRPLPA